MNHPKCRFVVRINFCMYLGLHYSYLVGLLVIHTVFLYVCRPAFTTCSTACVCDFHIIWLSTTHYVKAAKSATADHKQNPTSYPADANLNTFPQYHCSYYRFFSNVINGLSYALYQTLETQAVGTICVLATHVPCTAVLMGLRPHAPVPR